MFIRHFSSGAPRSDEASEINNGARVEIRSNHRDGIENCFKVRVKNLVKGQGGSRATLKWVQREHNRNSGLIKRRRKRRKSSSRRRHRLRPTG